MGRQAPSAKLTSRDFRNRKDVDWWTGGLEQSNSPTVQETTIITI
jgi:hypothetical protein